MKEFYSEIPIIYGGYYQYQEGKSNLQSKLPPFNRYLLFVNILLRQTLKMKRI